MFDTHVTVVGNVVAEPRVAQTRDGHAIASFRLASTPRRFDRAVGEWRDGETLFIGVTCWRALAENVALSLKKGSSVIVMGKLSIRPYETKDGDRRLSVDIDALAVGPDLGRAVAVIKRTERGVQLNAAEAAGGLGPDDDEGASAHGAHTTGAQANGSVSDAALSEHEWGWSANSGLANSAGGERVDDEVAPDAAADGTADAEPLAGEPRTAELAAVGAGRTGTPSNGGGRWRRAAS